MRSLFILGLLILAASCGGGGGSSSINSIPFSSSENLSSNNPAVAVDSAFTPGMGLLLTKKPGSLGLCTSFMISAKYLMTNSHCVTDISLSEDCSQSVGVHIKTNHGQEYRSCKKIVTKSTLTSGSYLKPDYAIIELSAPLLNAEPFEISRNGIVAGSELTLESVDFSQLSDGSIFGKRKISNCLTQTDSLLGNFTTAQSSIIPLFGDESLSEPCQVIHGNSGSPVFDSSRKVVSVVFATIERDKIGEINIKGSMRDMGLATNIACLKLGLPEFDQSRAKTCDAFLDDETKFHDRLQEKVNSEYNQKSADSVKEIQSKLVSTMKFDVQRTRIVEDNYRYTPVPTCIVHPHDWDNAEKLKITNDNRTFFKTRSYSTLIPRYSQVLEVSFDDFFRPSVSATLENVSSYTLTIPDLDKLIREGFITVTESVPNDLGVSKVTSRTLKLCE